MEYKILRVSFFLITLLSLIVLWCDGTRLVKSDKAQFWQTKVRKGANIFNRSINNTVISAAHQYNINFVRLAPDKFPTRQRDFLIGDADNYQGLVSEDLSKLKSILDSFHEKNIPIVLTMLSLPGSRWKQNNNDTDDLRLWTSSDFQKQAAQFWKDLASELKNHPGIVGYNILNEPHLDNIFNNDFVGNHSIDELQQSQIQSKLFRFNTDVIRSIREVDQVTPIILDSSGYAHPEAFEKFQLVNDTNILYSFHMYDPYVYTDARHNQRKFSYPGYIPSSLDEKGSKLECWDKSMLTSVLEPVRQFQTRWNISSDKILVGEFGGHRTSKGLELYFQDLISIFNEYGWHWGVYAFREDTWDGMDYELGSKGWSMSWGELEEIENGTGGKEYFPDNPIFTVLKEEWASR